MYGSMTEEIYCMLDLICSNLPQSRQLFATNRTLIPLTARSACAWSTVLKQDHTSCTTHIIYLGYLLSSRWPRGKPVIRCIFIKQTIHRSSERHTQNGSSLLCVCMYRSRIRISGLLRSAPLAARQTGLDGRPLARTDRLMRRK